MTEMAIFFSTFVLVFALGFQSLNVNNGHYIAAFLTSFAIGTANLVLFKTLPEADVLQVASYLLGGPFGIVASMLAHRAWMKPKRDTESQLQARFNTPGLCQRNPIPMSRTAEEIMNDRPAKYLCRETCPRYSGKQGQHFCILEAE